MKPICIISQHPDLEEFHMKFKEQEKFLSKRRDDLLEDATNCRKEFWAGFEKILDEKGLTKNAAKLHLSIENGVIYEKDCAEDGFANFLKNLLK